MLFYSRKSKEIDDFSIAHQKLLERKKRLKKAYVAFDEQADCYKLNLDLIDAKLAFIRKAARKDFENAKKH